MKKKKSASEWLWDAWCICSIVGIWPRFIEPNLLATRQLSLPIQNLPPALQGLKILQISDLHLNKGTTDYFLKKILNTINQTTPDLIVFTGDFLCYGRFPDKERLQKFFEAIPLAPLGNFAILGNHDYEKYVLVNEEGNYDTFKKSQEKSTIIRGFERLAKELPVTGNHTKEALHVPLNQELISFLEKTNFTLLYNRSITLPVGNSKLNLCGLGEHMVGKCLPKEAFSQYDKNYPGIILVHNPDAIQHLKEYPGDVILCGHTHGGQVNLPWMRDRFIVLEDRRYIKGAYRDNQRHIYVNRGLGGVMNFRWFSRPEILLLELE